MPKINIPIEDDKSSKDEMRALMGTLPNMNPELELRVLPGVTGIKAELFDAPENPYKLIYEAAVATWGDERYATKWPDTLPEHRFSVVKAALTGQTLPQALEVCSFMFIVRGASRSAFDQHARQRIGATFFSQGVRDNSRADAFFRMPTELIPKVDDPEENAFYEDLVEWIKQGKYLYREILKKGSGSFQSARSILPMGTTHNYKYGANLAALKGYMAQRLQACEQEDTVFVAISIWDQINQRFPLLASHLKPGCDYAHKCTYHKAYTLSEMFGCLFSGCGRWPDPDPYSTFNRSCSDYDTMALQGGVKLPDPGAWPEYESLDDLPDNDLKLFLEGWE